MSYEDRQPAMECENAGRQAARIVELVFGHSKQGGLASAACGYGCIEWRNADSTMAGKGKFPSTQYRVDSRPEGGAEGS